MATKVGGAAKVVCASGWLNEFGLMFLGSKRCRHRLPADAVQGGKDHARARRADVMKGALHNHAGFHAHQRQRTGTVAPVVRGFKIDGDEGGRGSG